MNPRGLAVVSMAMLLSACTGGGGDSGGSDEDASAQLACSTFYRVADDANAGVLTDQELRAGLQDVYDDARYSEIPQVRNAARDMLAAATAGDSGALEAAVNRMDTACAAVDPI